MRRFDTKGMMVFPNPIKKTGICKEKSLLLIKECFCHNGHKLITDQAVFNGEKGIMLKLKKGRRTGLVALSPVYGYKSRVSLELKLKPEDKWEICCPRCGEALPVYSSCTCEGDLVALFLDNKANFANSILICNRIDCFNAELKFNNEIVHYSNVEDLI